MDENTQDFCRVCRFEGTPERPLYYPCICTGSIKYIHQDCLVQWLKYSEKEYCELCSHRYSFIPIYSPDMPKRLPMRDIFSGLFSSLITAARYWLHYTIVAFAWLGIVPLTAYRIYKCLFSGSFSAMLSLPVDIFSVENLTSDGFYGCCVVVCTLCAFVSLIWLREQIIRGGAPDWLEIPPLMEQQHNNRNEAEIRDNLVAINHQDEPGIGENNNINNNNLGENGALEDELNGDQADRALLDVQNNVHGNENIVGEIEEDGVRDDVDEGQLVQDELNWNGHDWERGGEELTWERILGFDGSLVFLEHVFWVVSLNAIFIAVFAFIPFHIGLYVLTKLQWTGYASQSHFEGLVTTLCGYFIIGISIILLQAVTAILRFRRTARLLGLCYIGIKVSMLFICEMGIFPLVCGWWLDICSLPLLGASLADRESGFRSAPGTSMFIHWLIGMVYVFYFATFILLLKEVLRSGIFWFIQNLNDPNFNPIQEMIHLPVLNHLRHLSVSLVVFGTTVLLMIWLPITLVQYLLPGFLPYNISATSDSPVSELSLEFLLLQLVLPALLDHGHLREWIKSLVRAWCVLVSYVLDIRSYLLGDTSDTDAVENVDPNLVIVHSRHPVQPYRKPKYFALRMIFLLLITGVSITIGGLIVITVPVILGRQLIGVWLGDVKVHELNTFAAGLYVFLLFMRVITLICSWAPRGWSAIVLKMKEGVIIIFKALLAGLLLLGLIPLMIGFLFDIVVIVPLRVPLNQTPIYYLWQDWAFGVLHTKVICGIAMMAEWRLRDILQEIYNHGFINMDMRLILNKLVIPTVLSFGLVLAVPYVATIGILPLFALQQGTENLVHRRIYPFLLFLMALVSLVHWQINKFCRLYEHIKNDKYLVGKRLVNYDKKKSLAKPAGLEGSAGT